MLTFILMLIITLPDGEVVTYPYESGLTWAECETKGAIVQSYHSDINWYCHHEH